MEEYRSILFPK